MDRARRESPREDMMSGSELGLWTSRLRSEWTRSSEFLLCSDRNLWPFERRRTLSADRPGFREVLPKKSEGKMRLIEPLSLLGSAGTYELAFLMASAGFLDSFYLLG